MYFFKMNKIIITLLMQLQTLILFGQNDFCNCRMDQRSLFETLLTGQKFQMKKTYGSQQFPDGTFMGDIILTSGDTVRNKQISYNGYEDELIWTLPVTMSMIKVDKKRVNKFMIYVYSNEEPMGFRHLSGITSGKKQVDFFAEILLEDSLSLYARHIIQFVEKIEQDNEKIITLIDKIELLSPVFYIRLPDNTYLEIKHLRKRSLYSALPDYKESIRSLLNQHHQGLRKERDLIHIIQLINKFGIKPAKQL